jgi:adenylyltransferase/sulfurtransferase
LEELYVELKFINSLENPQILNNNIVIEDCVMELTSFIERYSRQIMLKEIGVKGQLKLFKSRVAIIGCGATGTAVAELLARTGVGFIRVVDRDVVELSNLHRTHLFRELDALESVPKAYACAQSLREVNSSIAIEYVVDSVSADNIEKLVRDVDIVIDGSDNVETRLLINEACIALDKPWIMIGVERWHGMTKFIDAKRGACYRCLVGGRGYRERGNVCEVLGVVNVIVSLLASIATTLTLKYLLELPVEEELFIANAIDLTIEKVKLFRNPRCPACVKREFVFLKRGGERVRHACGANIVEILPDKALKIDISRLGEAMGFEQVRIYDNKVAHIKTEEGDVLLLDNGKALIRNPDLSKAERLYNIILESLERLGLIAYL